MQFILYNKFMLPCVNVFGGKNMGVRTDKIKLLICLVFVNILLINLLIPISQATDEIYVEGFDKGPSALPVVPMKKVTFVQYDNETLLDDYAYLAAVPTAVFKYDDKLFSQPLLFYEDELPIKEEKDLSLNARQGINYFMEDWMSFCNGNTEPLRYLDQMTLINVPENNLEKSWKAENTVSIEEDNPYSIANELALRDWSYSDDAVISVIDEEFPKPNNVLNSEVKGTLSNNKDIVKLSFFTNELDNIVPRFHEFEVPEGYKYLKSRTWWACYQIGTPSGSALPIGIHVAIPTADPDSQIYCKYNDEWMLVAVTQGWNIGGMDKERTEAYVYNSGPWRLGITDIPTFALGDRIERYGSIVNILKNMIKGVTYQTDITLFPGTEVKIPDSPFFGCRDATFKLTWDNPKACLGFSLIGPGGEEILSASEEDTDFQEIHLDQIGECLPGESYSVSVFSLGDTSGPVNFKVQYNWQQNFSKAEADSLSSATEGAVLASTLNAPLLYTSTSKLSQKTQDVIHKLGVKNIYLVDLGGHLKNNVRDEIDKANDVKEDYQEPEQIYRAIMDLTGQNDIIFSTIDPWTQWYVGEMKPSDETKAGLFVGPAAYCAAHHESPVIIVDNHPELSSAVTWHTEFWKLHGDGFQEPTVAPMYLTGKRVYDFLKRLGYDKEGEETMITIAGQYEIGATWDRAFAGKAKPGRIFGKPVDTAYWISRNVFYPALIFENPAVDPNGVTLVQGSESVRRNLIPWGQFGLKIVKDQKKELFKYPILQSYISYQYNMNEQFEKYYGFRYKSADNIVPGVTESFNPIDDGAVMGKEGAIWPDLSQSDVIPFYAEKGGYDNVFSSSNEAITGNLNQGVILWILDTHGNSQGSGFVYTWGAKNSNFAKSLPSLLSNRFGYTKESNPWRCYEWYLGSTENPDTLTMEVHGFIPAILGNPDLNGLFPTGEDFWPSERPLVNTLAKIPILKWFLPKGWRDNTLYKDGMVNSHTISNLVMGGINGYTLDDMLNNTHSCGWINTACLPAYKYMHLTMIRHGSVFQVIDPWSTSWYGSFWAQSIPRDIISGDTVGEAYLKGITHVGILYITDPPQWWWDILNNVCYFGDPDLRIFVPGTEYSDKNQWTKEDTEPLRYNEYLSINGHTPFGATNYPNAKKEGIIIPFWVILIILIGLLLIISILLLRKK